jgi:hypothetical protein
MNNFNFTAFTIETWFYSNRPSLYFGDQILFTNSTYEPGMAEGFTLKFGESGDVVLSLANMGATGWHLAISDTILPTRKWHHIVGTYDGNYLRVYLNGRLSATTFVGPTYPFPHDNAHIGCGVRVGSTTGEFLLDGKIDEMKIYNYALSPDSISAHCKSLGIPPVLTRHKVNFGMQTVTGNPGDDVWVPIYITNFDEALTLTACDFSLFIDTNFVSFVDAIVDSGIASNWIIEKNALAKDSIKIGLDGANHSLGYGEGELLRCRYHIKQTVADAGFTDIRFKYANVTEDTLLNITTTPGKISFSKPTVTFGDVTGNGIVSAMDGAKVLQFVVGALPIPDASVPNWSLAVVDVSGDKTISSYDAALIFKYSVGLISRFPAEPSKMLPKRMISNSTSSTTVPPVADAKVRSALVLKTAQINEGNIPCTIAYETGGGFAHNNTIELSGANIALLNRSELFIKTSPITQVSVRIFDVKGCALVTKVFPADAGMVTLQLNTLPVGMYLLKVNQGTSSILKPQIPMRFTVHPSRTSGCGIRLNSGFRLTDAEVLEASGEFCNCLSKNQNTYQFTGGYSFNQETKGGNT